MSYFYTASEVSIHFESQILLGLTHGWSDRFAGPVSDVDWSDRPVQPSMDQTSP